MRARLLVSGVWAVLVVAAGCGGAPGSAPSPVSASTAAPSTGSTGSTTASTAPTDAAPTAPVGTRPVIDCLNGTYRLVRLTDVAADAPYRSGTGGDVELRFSGAEFPDGNYVGTAYGLVAAGRRKTTLTADGTTSTLSVEAEAQGSYTLDDSQARFDYGPGKGSGRVRSGGTTRTLTLSEVQRVVAPVGTLTVSCTRTTLWLTGGTTQYELRSV